MPEKHKNIRKFTKRRLQLYSRIREFCHQNKKPLSKFWINQQAT